MTSNNAWAAKNHHINMAGFDCSRCQVDNSVEKAVAKETPVATKSGSEVALSAVPAQTERSVVQKSSEQGERAEEQPALNG